MTNPDLLNYLKQELRKGKSAQTVKAEMMAGGWQEGDIDEGFDALQTGVGVSTTNKKPWMVIAIICIALIGGGATLAYYLINNTPEKTIERMIHNLEKVKAYKSKGNIKIEMTSNSGEPVTENTSYLKALQTIQTAIGATSVGSITSEFEIHADAIDEGNLKGLFKINGGYKMPSAEEMTADVEARILNKQIYINLKKIPNLFGDASMSMLENKWIKIDAATTSSISPEVSDLLLATESAQYKKIKENEANIKAAYLRNKFIVFDKSVPTETINSVETKHYKFSLDKAKLKSFYIEALPLIIDASPEEIMEMTRILKEDDTYDTLGSFTGDLWIGKKDTLPYKMSMNIVIADPTTPQSTATLNATIELSDYDIPLNIEVPADAKTFEELGAELMQSYDSGDTGTVLSRSRDARRLADVTTIKYAIETARATGSLTTLPICTKTTNQVQCSSQKAGEWLPLDVSEFLASQPSDPSNGQTITTLSGKEVKAYYYYRSNGTTYKIAAYIESPSYKNRAAEDGGTDPDMYEIGDNLELPI